jgi:sulfatase maturation enzyme AslB (radical SAM superfamily)
VSEKIVPEISFDGTPDYQRVNRPMNNDDDSYEVVLATIQKIKKKIPDSRVSVTLCKDADNRNMS